MGIQKDKLRLDRFIGRKINNQLSAELSNVLNRRIALDVEEEFIPFRPDDPGLITNFSVSSLEKYRRAIEIFKSRTGKDILYVYRHAYWKNGYLDDKLMALRCRHGHTKREAVGIMDILHEVELEMGREE